MSQGFTSDRRKVDKNEMRRWAFYSHTMNQDQLPDHPDVLLVVIQALLGRIRRMSRTKGRNIHGLTTIAAPGDIEAMRNLVRALLRRINQLDRTRNKDLTKRIKIYIGIIAQRCRFPGELEINWLYHHRMGHYDDLFSDELKNIENERLIAFSCIPAVLRLQRDYLYECMKRYGPDGYAPKDTPSTWLNRNHKRLHEELIFYKCSCRYFPDLKQVDCSQKGPGELIPAILAGLHKGSTASSIRQILKKSARPSKLPNFLR